MKTFLITGGAGFIGSALTSRLAGGSNVVRVLDDFSTGLLANLEQVADGVQLIRGDILDEPQVTAACADVDCVFHLAALASVQHSIAEPLRCNMVNVHGTLSVLDAARRVGVRRVVFASSCSVYGNSEVAVRREDMVPAPLSPYAASKLAGEGYVSSFWEAYGLETVSLRFFNVYGPHQDGSSPYSGVLAAFITRMLAGRQPVIYGDGQQTRDFIFVEDVVDALLSAAAAPKDNVCGRAINVGTGVETSVLQAFQTVRELIGFTAEPIREPARAGEIRRMSASTGEAERLLGFRGSRSFREGLADTVAWYRRMIENYLRPRVS